MLILKRFSLFLITAVLSPPPLCSASDIHGVLVNKEACGGTPAHFNLTGGTIMSPLHPRGPPSQVSCTWILHNPFEDTLILSFNIFDLAQDTKCGKRLHECCPHQWLLIRTEPTEQQGVSSRSRRATTMNQNTQSNKTPNGRTGSQKNPIKSVERKRNARPSPSHQAEEINLKKEWFDLPLFKTPIFNGSLGDFLMTRSQPRRQDEETSTGLLKDVFSDIRTPENSKKTERVCGKTRPLPVLTKDPKVIVKFYSDAFVELGHLGFSIQFQISNNLTVCNAEEFMCNEPQLCIPKSWQCNGQVECPDATDEADCQAGCAGLADSEHCDGRWHCENGEDELGCFGCDADEFWCGEGTECYKAARRCDGIADCNNRADEVYCNCFNETRCGPNSEFCYDPKTQRCDGVLHCPNGNDEMDCGGHCHHMIPCSHGGVCYTSAQRCDGTPQCGDGSDEASCTPQLCHPQHGAFLCANRRCIRDTWRCDQYDDCGDASDEEDCLRNSVIVAAAMGGLVCSLLLVIAVGCSCRLYALRIGLSRQAQQGLRGGRRSTQLSPLSRLEQHLLQREPPPSYAVAVNDPSAALFGSRRISRQWRRQRRRPPAPPEGILPPLPVPMRGRVAPGPPRHYDGGPGHASSVRGFAGSEDGHRNGQSNDVKETEEGSNNNNKAVTTTSSTPPRLQNPLVTTTTTTDEEDVPLLSAVGDADETEDAPLLEVASSASDDSGADEEDDDAVLLDVAIGMDASDSELSELEGGADHPESSALAAEGGRAWSITNSPGALFGPFSSIRAPEAAPEVATEAVLEAALCDNLAIPEESSAGQEANSGLQGDSSDASSQLDDAITDVITDTRAAVLALSVVQRHTNDVEQSDTELKTH